MFHHSVAESVGCSQGGAGAMFSGAGRSSTEDADDTIEEEDDETWLEGPELEEDSEGGTGYGHGDVVGTSSVGAY